MLTVAGSDSGGGAGVQADLKTAEACSAFATSAVTAVTAQHTRGVESIHVLPLEEISAQIEAVRDDFAVSALKTGMLATEPVIELVADHAADLAAPTVVDPVMVATSGDRLLDPEAEGAYEELLAHATLATPNAEEAKLLTGVAVDGYESAVEAGRVLRGTGVDAVLVTGGHVAGDTVQDVLVTADSVETFEHPRVDTAATHGSGCALASAVAARLAHGESLTEAVQTGTDLLARAIRYHHDVGEGPGAVHHLVALRERAARDRTAEAVESVVQWLVDADVSPAVPEVGMNVVGATPYAESPEETAAVEGRITRTRAGMSPNRGVRFGASSHVARFLLGAREFDPALRFAVNCRFDTEVEQRLNELEGVVGEIDRRKEPDPDEESSTMGWAVRRAFERADESPVAVYDRGAVGKEPVVRVLASDAETVTKHVLTLAGRV